MNKQKYQQGSAHVVVIALLVLALLGTLGFVFWQNYIKVNEFGEASLVTDAKDDEGSETTQPITNTDTNSYLSISEWGVKGVWNNDYAVTYTVLQTGNMVSFTTDNLTGSCAGKSVAMISRLTGDQLVIFPGDEEQLTASQRYSEDKITQFGGNKKIGDYYYMYISPQQGCYQQNADGSYSAGVDAPYYESSYQVHELFTTLVAL